MLLCHASYIVMMLACLQHRDGSSTMACNDVNIDKNADSIDHGKKRFKNDSNDDDPNNAEGHASMQSNKKQGEGVGILPWVLHLAAHTRPLRLLYRAHCVG